MSDDGGGDYGGGGSGGGGGNNSPDVAFSGYDFPDSRTSDTTTTSPAYNYNLPHKLPSIEHHVHTLGQYPAHSEESLTTPVEQWPNFGHQSTNVYRQTVGRYSHYSSAHDSTFNDDDDDDDDEDVNSDDVPVMGLSHGFSLGNVCPDLARASSTEKIFDEVDEDDETRDEGISEVYFDTKGLIAPSPVTGKRHVISKIDGVGVVAQNIAIGHRIGVFADDSQLIPHQIVPKPLQIEVEEDTPLQIDITWSPPANAHNFSTLTYHTELLFTQTSSWSPVGSSCKPVFRVFHTDDVMFVGRNRICRQNQDLEVKLRVRVSGDVKQSRLTVNSEWSEHVVIVFVGYQTERNTVQMTNL